MVLLGVRGCGCNAILLLWWYVVGVIVDSAAGAGATDGYCFGVTSVIGGALLGESIRPDVFGGIAMVGGLSGDGWLA